MDVDISELHLSVQERIQLTVTRLPTLVKGEVPLEDSCPICLNPFDAILEGKATEPLGGATPNSNETVGVTKLVGCGHIFCKVCLVEWIRGRHGSCPSCRDVFSSIKPPSDSDNESSDGDYVPGDDEDDDEDDGFFDSDGFMETESMLDDMDMEEVLVDEMDLDDEEVDIGVWEDHAANVGMENWGLSDGEGSEGVSEGEGLAVSVELSVNDEAEVYSDGGESSGSLQVSADNAAEPKR